MSEDFLVDRRRRHSAPAIAVWKKLKSHKPSERVRLIKGKYLCLVTGAGNGLGRAVAGLAFQDQGIFPFAMADSKVILVDSDEEGLKETSGKKMRQFLKHRKIDVELMIVDLSDLNETKAMLDKIVSTHAKDYEHVIFINNATTIGNVANQLTDMDDIGNIQKFWDLNITSRMYLTSRFCKEFYRSKRTVVHTFRFDIARSTPFLGMSYMSQNAIDAFGETFAKENPAIHVLHFTPYRIDTEKTKRVAEDCGNEDLREKISSYYELNQLQQPLESAKRMTKVLEENDFKEGEVMRIEEERYFNSDNNNNNTDA